METIKEESALGIVKISDEVVSVIAGIAASEIDGIIEIPNGVGNNISQILKGKKANNGKSVRVTLSEDKAIIDLAIAVQYGINIPDVVVEAQENIKKTVEAMTGLVVNEINISVQNIYMVKQENLKEE